jgi:hypothetical protein
MGNAHEQITELEAEIDDLHDQLQRCRKIELGAKAVLAAGSATLALGLFWGTPISFVIAIGAILGSVALLGSNRRSLQDTIEALRLHEAKRLQIIEGLELRPVEALDGSKR